MTIKLRVACDTLTDGSSTYAVVVTDQAGAYMVFDTITEHHALAFASGLKVLFDNHTNETATFDGARAAAAPAPVATEYVLVCQPNSAIKPTLEIKIYGHSAQSARASGITIGTMLFAVGYSRFGVFEDGKLVSEFTLSQPDIVVK